MTANENAPDFPEESVKQAREIAKKYRQRTKSGVGIAEQLQDRDFYEVQYGFSESVRTGNCGRHLHEIEKEGDCFVLSGATYLIAREAGLKPRLYHAHELKDVGEGERSDAAWSADHAFITVETKKGERYIVDPSLGKFGRVKFLPDSHVIEVYNPATRQIVRRHYVSLKEISEKEHLKLMDKSRRLGGGRIALSGTQRVSGSGGAYVFVTFLPDESKIRSSIRHVAAMLGPEPYDRNQIIDLETRVEDDGFFDFAQGDFSFYSASSCGWNSFVNQQSPLKFSSRGIAPLFGLYQGVVSSNGRVAPVYRMSGLRLTELLWNSGIGSDFSVQGNSEAARVVAEQGLAEELRECTTEKRERIREYVASAKGDEVSYKVLLRRAHTTKKRDAVRSKENPWGIVSTKEERDRFLREAFKGQKMRNFQFAKQLIRSDAVSIGLEDGTRYSNDRRLNTSIGLYLEQSRYFSHIAGAVRSPFKRTFEIHLDGYLLRKPFDLEKMSVSELSEGLTELDIERAAEEDLFHRTVCAFMDRDALLLGRYKKGLQRLLRKPE